MTIYESRLHDEMGRVQQVAFRCALWLINDLSNFALDLPDSQYDRAYAAIGWLVQNTYCRAYGHHWLDIYLNDWCCLTCRKWRDAKGRA